MANMNICRPCTQRSLRRQQEMLGHREKARYEQPFKFYTTATGVDRVIILHPTKGWRDRREDGLWSN